MAPPGTEPPRGFAGLAQLVSDGREELARIAPREPRIDAALSRLSGPGCGLVMLAILALEVCIFLPLFVGPTTGLVATPRALSEIAFSSCVLLALVSRKIRGLLVLTAPMMLAAAIALAVILRHPWSPSAPQAAAVHSVQPPSAALAGAAPASAASPASAAGGLASADARRLTQPSPAAVKLPVPTIGAAAPPVAADTAPSSAPALAPSLAPSLASSLAPWPDCLSAQTAIEATGLFLPDEGWAQSVERYNTLVRAFARRCGYYKTLPRADAIGHRLSGAEILLLTAAAQARVRAWMLLELQQRATRQPVSPPSAPDTPQTPRQAPPGAATAAPASPALQRGQEERAAWQQICMPDLRQSPQALRPCQQPPLEALRALPEADTSALSADEQASVQLICLGAGTAGLADLRLCERRELSEATARAPVDTAGLLREEREALALACLADKAQGLAAFRLCQQEQLQARHGGPDLAGVSLASYQLAAAQCIKTQSVGLQAFDACLSALLQPRPGPVR